MRQPARRSSRGVEATTRPSGPFAHARHVPGTTFSPAGLRRKAKETSAARRFVETVAQWCGVSISTRSSNAWLRSTREISEPSLRSRRTSRTRPGPRTALAALSRKPIAPPGSVTSGASARTDCAAFVAEAISSAAR